MRQKWEEDEAGWHKLPARAWPARQPKPEELPTLRAQLRACPPADASAELWLKAPSHCAERTFDLATCLAFYRIDAGEGVRTYRAMAERGDAEAMVGVGVVLLEEIYAEPSRPQQEAAREGVSWLWRASQLDSSQAHYELATLFYLGCPEAGLEADEARAFRLFERAAAQEHTVALRDPNSRSAAGPSITAHLAWALGASCPDRRAGSSWRPTSSSTARAARATPRAPCACCTRPPSADTAWRGSTCASGWTRTPPLDVRATLGPRELPLAFQ